MRRRRCERPFSRWSRTAWSHEEPRRQIGARYIAARAWRVQWRPGAPEAARWTNRPTRSQTARHGAPGRERVADRTALSRDRPLLQRVDGSTQTPVSATSSGVRQVVSDQPNGRSGLPAIHNARDGAAHRNLADRPAGAVREERADALAEQVAQIAASIVEFGFTNPILVDSNDGIIAGHGRLLAARKLGLAEVPVVVLDHLQRDSTAGVHHRGQQARAQRRMGREDARRARLRALEEDGLDLPSSASPTRNWRRCWRMDGDTDADRRMWPKTRFPNRRPSR